MSSLKAEKYRAAASILLFLPLAILLCRSNVSAADTAKIISAKVTPHKIIPGGKVCVEVSLANTGNNVWRKNTYGVLLRLKDPSDSDKVILQTEFYPGKTDLRPQKAIKMKIDLSLPKKISGEFYFRVSVYVNKKGVAGAGPSESLKVTIARPLVSQPLPEPAIAKKSFKFSKETAKETEESAPALRKEFPRISAVKGGMRQFTFGDLDWVMRRYGRNTALALNWKDVSKAQIYWKSRKIESEYEEYEEDQSYSYFSGMGANSWYNDYSYRETNGYSFRIGRWGKSYGWYLDYAHESHKAYSSSDMVASLVENHVTYLPDRPFENDMISFSMLTRYPSKFFSPYTGAGLSITRCTVTVGTNNVWYYDQGSGWNESSGWHQPSEWELQVFVPVGISLVFPGTGFGLLSEVRVFPFNDEDKNDAPFNIEQQYRVGFTLAL
ncbi:hypothetical protein HY772_08155 [Candidatus Woesearchaeota archaeon]|nr:hypothetical protein [Candidatus Woesearchaeota archaeon]